MTQADGSKTEKDEKQCIMSGRTRPHSGLLRKGGTETGDSCSGKGSTLFRKSGQQQHNPNCVNGRDCAEYKVTNADADGNEVLQNFANNLDKTGEFGVQWGMDGTKKCDFYSVYPSVNNGHSTSITPSPDGSGVTVRAHIRPSQFCVFNANSDATAYSGTPYDETYTDGTMPDAFMYAVTPDQDNGTEVVNLRYTPFSTVLKFHFAGFTTSVDLTSPYIYLQKVILTAPDGVTVAGNFDVTISKDGSVTSSLPVADSEASNDLEVNTILPGGSYVRLGKNMPIDFSIFTIPQDGLSLSDTWNVVMQTNAGNFRYKLKPSTNNTGKNSNLVAGQVHKLNIPILTVTKDITLNPADWMTQIPRNVYLSELSLPGSWYSVLEEYQGTGVDIATQYAAGVRAFNLDCRLTQETDDSNSSLRLVCAGTDGVGTAGWGYDGGDLVLDKMKEIGALIANNPEEYVVVVLTVAEKPMTRKPLIGATKVYGTVAPKEVLKAIATMLADSSLDSYIYKKPITPNTTVSDVLGKIIVKVNANTSNFRATSYTSIPHAMVSLASMAGGAGYTDYTDIVNGVFNSMQTSTIYNSKTDSGLTFYYHQAQKTYASGSTSSPNLDERHAAIDDITAQSRTIYENNLHNAWFQIGIGGYNADEDTDKLTTASDLNDYLLKKVQKKLLGQEGLAPSPVGIMLMNYCTGDSSNGNGAALVKAILEMNTMFRLTRDPAKPEWPNQTNVDGGGESGGDNGGSSGGGGGI